MDPKLEQLIEKAKNMVVTDEDKEAQRRSFAYGNVALDDPRVTRQDVDKAAERMALCTDCSKAPDLCVDMGCSCTCHMVRVRPPEPVGVMELPPELEQLHLLRTKIKRLEAREKEYRTYLTAAACQIDALSGVTGTGLWGLAIHGDEKSKAEAGRLKNQADLVSSDIRAMLEREFVEDYGDIKVGQWVVSPGHGTYRVEELSVSRGGVWVSGEGPNGSLGCYLPSVRPATDEEIATAETAFMFRG
jgi:hypothetical protein